MATLVLSAVGSALGGQIGGSVLGVSAAALGRAAGGVAGALIDQRLLGPGAAAVEGPRIARFRVPGGGEGAALPRVWGRMRVGTHAIWAARFKETATRDSVGGGKGAAGGGAVTRYSYSASFALALCEGPIDRIGRIWADSQEISPSDLPHRLYLGDDNQEPDPLIAGVEGADNAPAYRGVAYLVLEDLPLERFGNRIPQISVEVFRAPRAVRDPEPPLSDLIRAVALIPGAGEFALAVEPVRRRVGEGVYETENVHSFDGRPDLLVSLDQLAAELPKVESVSLIVAWYGDDLRCGRCRVRPAVESRDRVTEPLTWAAGGDRRETAALVSTDAQGRPALGGSPADLSVVQAIQELKRRGWRVTLYPFLMLDVPPDNSLADPWSGAPRQPAYPWRGRLTLDVAPGRAGSTDGAPAAAAEVDAFFGAASAAQLAWDGTALVSSAPDQGYRRFILSMARLAEAAGGVDAFVIGSEMRSLTQIRSGPDAYPAVAHLRALAADVRAVLGPETKLTYAADWSEYFGHQPADGSGEVRFHLDPLWADPVIDAVGVDAYFPLSDWGEDGDPSAPDAPSIADLGYLRSNIEGGEHYDYWYAGDAGRRARARNPIADGAHGEEWIYRPKDLRGWWANAPHARAAAGRAADPSPWVPQSKPIWLTELGCPAVDRGSNQPNLFSDGKSSESALPWASRGMRDDFIQRRYLQALLGYWDGPANPVSARDGRRMIDLANSAVWAWDARPWPDFPLRTSVWSDGPAQPAGHWLQGRLGGAPLADLVAEICVSAGLAPADIDVSRLEGLVDGYLADRVMSARELLQGLMLAYAFDAVESGGALKFAPRGGAPIASLTLDALVVAEGDEDPDPPLERVRDAAGAPPQAVRLAYVDGASDYRAAAVEARRAVAGPDRLAAAEAPIALSEGRAQAIAERQLAETWVARDRARFRLPSSAAALEPGDVVSLDLGARRETYRIARIADLEAREIDAVRCEPALYAPSLAPERLRPPPEAPFAAPPEMVVFELPLLTGEEIPHAPWVAAAVAPWPGPLAIWRSALSDDGFVLDGRIDRAAGLGRLLDPLPPARPGLWTRGAPARVRLTGRDLLSREPDAVLAGANALAVEAAPGRWEVIQFQTAELIAPDAFALSRLLRGQAGGEGTATLEIPIGARVAVLDGALAQTRLPLDALGLERHYRVGAAARGADPGTTAHQSFAARGVGLAPYAPAHLRARTAPDGGLDVSWIRRARLGGDRWSDAEVPLGETRERYRLRLEKDGVVTRTLETDAPNAVIDPGSAPPRPFVIAVAQLSDLVGWGAEARLALV